MSETSPKIHVGRPIMPSGYGIAPLDAQATLIPWEHVSEQLRTKRNYWIGSTRPDGRPHAMPVWGVWLEPAVYFSTDPELRKGRNLAADPRVVVHLESGDDVVILEGRVEQVTDAALLKSADEAYFNKYEFHLAGDLAAPGLIYRLRPRSVLAWFESSFPTTATRWTFDYD